MGGTNTWPTVSLLKSVLIVGKTSLWMKRLWIRLLGKRIFLSVQPALGKILENTRSSISTPPEVCRTLFIERSRKCTPKRIPEPTIRPRMWKTKPLPVLPAARRSRWPSSSVLGLESTNATSVWRKKKNAWSKSKVEVWRIRVFSCSKTGYGHELLRHLTRGATASLCRR